MKVFLSCVTREFGSCRLRLAEQLSALPAPNTFEVKVQEDFVQGGFTLLDQLAAYIRDCDLVIHLAGNLAGARPSEEHVRAMFDRLGQPAPSPLPTLSYTQWEYDLALRFGRRMLCYIAKDEARRDCAQLPSGCAQPPADAALQQAHRARIECEGKHYGQFAGHHDLIRQVFHDLELSPRDKASNLPFGSIGSLFKGRDEFLEKLRDTLGEAGHRGAPRAAAITGAPTAAVHGLGGIGKTRAAIEYAYRYWDEYTALLFAVADSPQNLESQLARLTGAAILNLPEQDEREQSKQVAAALRWLQRNPGWLLILDNVDSEDAAKAAEELVGQLAGSGQVVITSRLGRWGAEVESLDLDLLSEAAATQYLLESTEKDRRKESDDEPRAKEIALELGQLALALEQAGASINARHWTFARYLQMWRANRDRMMAELDSRLAHYPKSVAITWLTTFEQLTDDGRRLLRILAWLAPDPIPRSLLEAGGGPFVAANEEGAPKKKRAASVLEAEDALADIERYSLAKSKEDKLSFTVHRLVQDVMRRNESEDEQNHNCAAALRWVNSGFVGEPDDVRSWPVLEPLAAHARAVAEEADRRSIPEPTARLMSQLGILLYRRAEWSQAEPMFRRALAIDEQSYGPDHPAVATRLNNLAGLLYDTNRLAEAEPMFRRALAIDEKSYGAGHPEVATDLNNLALLLRATNRLAEAEPMFRRALAIDEKSLGPEHPKVAKRLNNLALLLGDTNRLAEAEPLYRRALAIGEKSLGAEDTLVGIALNNLASFLDHTNRLAEAEPLYRRALAIWEKSFGVEHPEVAKALHNIALLLRATNRLSEAEPLMRRAIDIFEKGLGPEHPNTASALLGLALLLQATNRLADAEPLFRRALAIRERSLVPGHPDTFKSMERLTELLEATGRFEEAVPLRQRILEDQKNKLGPDHPDTLLGWNNQSYEFRKRGLVSECEPIDRRIADATARTMGATHPLTLHRLNNIVLDLLLQGRAAEALPLLAQNWQAGAERFANLTPRIPFLAYIASLLGGHADPLYLGQVKTLLTGPELPINPDIQHPWDFAYILGQLHDRLSAGAPKFLTAIVAALNDRSSIPALDTFPEWRNQTPIPLETPWPES
jgi:tetratricopeptide (TPR) repeat protein